MIPHEVAGFFHLYAKNKLLVPADKNGWLNSPKDAVLSDLHMFLIASKTMEENPFDRDFSCPFSLCFLCRMPTENMQAIPRVPGQPQGHWEQFL